MHAKIPILNFPNGNDRQSVCMLSRFGHVQLFETLWIIAHWAPLSMGFSPGHLALLAYFHKKPRNYATGFPSSTLPFKKILYVTSQVVCF